MLTQEISLKPVKGEPVKVTVRELSHTENEDLTGVGKKCTIGRYVLAAIDDPAQKEAAGRCSPRELRNAEKVILDLTLGSEAQEGN